MTIPDEVQDLIQKLNFIGYIPIECKLNVSNNKLSYSSGTWGNLWRYIGAESRDNTFKYISDLIDKTSIVIEKYKDTEFIKHIIDSLKIAKNGINNLLKTYDYDNLYKSYEDDRIKELIPLMTKVKLYFQKY